MKKEPEVLPLPSLSGEKEATTPTKPQTLGNLPLTTQQRIIFANSPACRSLLHNLTPTWQAVAIIAGGCCDRSTARAWLKKLEAAGFVSSLVDDSTNRLHRRHFYKLTPSGQLFRSEVFP